MTSSHIRAAIYARVSSQRQAEEDTIASQIEALEQRVAADGLRLEADCHFIDDGYSGTTLERPALEQLRDQIAAGALDRLYVHCPDRLSRVFAQQLVLIDEFKRAGLDVIFLNRAISNSPEDQLLLQMQGAFAEFERTRILERSRRGRRYAAQRGCVSVLSGAPYGYRYIRKHEGGGQARYEIDDEAARVVVQIFTWVGLERCTLSEACRRLKSRQIPSPAGQPQWNRTSIWALLTNRAYIGQAEFGKWRSGPARPRLRPPRGKSAKPRRASAAYATAPAERTLIPVPALVDADLFAAAAEQLEENRRRARAQPRGARYLLQGLLVCAHCGYACHGRPTHYKTADGQRHDYAYYRCAGTDGHRFGGQHLCDNAPSRTELLEGAVWDDACALLADPQRLRREYERRRQTPAAGNRPQERLAKLAAKVRASIERLIDAYEEGVLHKTEFEPRLQAARQRLAQLEAEVTTAAQHEMEQADLQAALSQLETFAQQIGAGLQQADWQTRRSILRALIKEVKMGKEEIAIVYKVNPCPFEQSPERGTWQHCWGRRRRVGGL